MKFETYSYMDEDRDWIELPEFKAILGDNSGNNLNFLARVFKIKQKYCYKIEIYGVVHYGIESSERITFFEFEPSIIFDTIEHAKSETEIYIRQYVLSKFGGL